MDSHPAHDSRPEPTEPNPGLAAWIKQNSFSLAIGLAVVVAIFRYLNPADVILAALGLTAIIFLHELGHFAAAKLCKVRVETFSIGFGPALPFCSYKYGETTYKLAMVPLGGFVKMLGEGEGASDEEGDDDPRSFKNQSVGERMFIISAGVIMNILFGAVLFVVVYMHGLEEQPATIARMEPAGAAWRAGLHSGTEIEKIASRENPWFDDIRPIIWFTDRGEQLPMVFNYRGEQIAMDIEPLKGDESPYPVIGISPPDQPVLSDFKRNPAPPYRRGTVAAQASPALESGDRIVAMTDPESDGAVTPLQPTAEDPPAEILVLHKRMALLAGKPVTLHVRRKGQAEDAPPTVITLPPSYHKTTGLRMRMGEITALRQNSPATTAKTPVQPGDQITEVEVTDANGVLRIWSADPKALGTPREETRIVVPLDPVTLPLELNRWADAKPNSKTVKLTVLRDVDHSRKPIVLDLTWDDLGRFDVTMISSPTNPVALNGLGLAYQALTVVDGVVPDSPAAQQDIQPNDRIVAVQFKAENGEGKVTEGAWQDIKPTYWAYINEVLQKTAPFTVVVRIDRGGETREVTLQAIDDPNHPTEDRGLLFKPETRLMQAESILEALTMGGQRTLRSIQSIYMNLYAMAFGRVSFTKTVSGPITLARASYIIAGEDIWKLILLLALISINLAVVNFLPIPVLDGGHMMFLTYEWIRGKPAPDSVQTILTFVGLGLILLLMLTVVGLDIWRLF